VLRPGSLRPRQERWSNPPPLATRHHIRKDAACCVPARCVPARCVPDRSAGAILHHWRRGTTSVRTQRAASQRAASQPEPTRTELHVPDRSAGAILHHWRRGTTSVRTQRAASRRAASQTGALHLPRLCCGTMLRPDEPTTNVQDAILDAHARGAHRPMKSCPAIGYRLFSRQPPHPPPPGEQKPASPTRPPG
jgi:hypothetical protein